MAVSCCVSALPSWVATLQSHSVCWQHQVSFPSLLLPLLGECSVQTYSDTVTLWSRSIYFDHALHGPGRAGEHGNWVFSYLPSLSLR